MRIGLRPDHRNRGTLVPLRVGKRPSVIANRHLRPSMPSGQILAIAFCSDEERPYLRDIEKLTRCSLRAIPLAIPAPHNDPVERPARVKFPREGGVLRQTRTSGGAAPARHPPRPAGSEARHPDPPVTGSLPAFSRRPSSTKPSSVGRRSERRGRSVLSSAVNACSKDPRHVDRARGRRNRLFEGLSRGSPNGRRQRPDH